MKVRLKKDLIIKAGTVFEDTKESTLVNPFVNYLSLSDDNTMFMAVWDAVIEFPEMFEKVE